MIHVLIYIYGIKPSEEDIGIDKIRSDHSLTYADHLFRDTPLPGHKCTICQEDLNSEPLVVLPCNT